MTSSKKVYLASDVLLAFIDRTHERHRQAAAFFRFFSQEGYSLFTDVISLYETYKNLHDHMSPSIAKDFLRTVYISTIAVYYPDDSDMRAALKIYLNDKSNELTFRKAVMTVTADRRKIPQIATFEYIHTMFGLSIFYIPL